MLLRMRASIWLVAIWAGCRTAPPPLNALRPAGDRTDDGSGVLARASTDLRQLAVVDSSAAPVASAADGRNPWQAGSPATGGITYGSYQPPALPDDPPVAAPYGTVSGPPARTTGTITGIVRWTGAVPAVVATPCGPWSSVRLGARNGLGSVVVSIEKPTRVHDAALPEYDFEQRATKAGCSVQPQLLVAKRNHEIWFATDAASAQLDVRGATPSTVALGPFGATMLQPQREFITVAQAGMMPGFVRIVDTPLYAATDDNGAFVLENVVPGTYQLRFWHPPIVTVEHGQVTWGPPLEVQRHVSVRAGGVANLTVELGSANRAAN